MPDEELEKYMVMWDKMRAAGVGPVPASELPSHQRSQLLNLLPDAPRTDTPAPGTNGMIKG